MKKDTIKNIVMAIAIFLAFALATGWIVQTLIVNQNQSESKMQPASNFSVTPESNRIMRLSATALSSDAEQEEAFEITAMAVDENGDRLEEHQLFDWSMAWVSHNTGNVTDYVTMTVNGAKATFVCRQAFGTQITVTCSSKLNSSVKATATLDYRCKVSDVKAMLGNAAQESISGSPVINVEFPSNFSNGITNAEWMMRNLNWGSIVEWSAGTLENHLNNVTFEFIPSEELRTAYKGGYGRIREFDAVTAMDTALLLIDSYAYFCATATGASIESLIGQSTLYYLLQAYRATDNQYTVKATVYTQYGEARTYIYTLNIEVAATKVQNVNIDNTSHIF